MSRENAPDSELLGRLPRHRARGRSPHRASEPAFWTSEARLRGEPSRAPDPPEAGAAEAAQDAVRMAAEVADIALTAAALLMRELLIRLEGSSSPPDAAPDNQQ